jgi:hypothetical protein
MRGIETSTAEAELFGIKQVRRAISSSVKASGPSVAATRAIGGVVLRGPRPQDCDQRTITLESGDEFRASKITPKRTSRDGNTRR